MLISLWLLPTQIHIKELVTPYWVMAQNSGKKNTVKDCIHAIKDLAPDLIIVAGWSELIPNEILSIPRMGVIGFHPAKLPFDRGRSVLAWQIEDGYTETSLTMFKYSDYPDGETFWRKKLSQ